MNHLIITQNTAEEIDIIYDNERFGLRRLNPVGGLKAVILLNPEEAKRVSDFIKEQLKRRA